MQIKKIIVIGEESVGKTSIINIFQNKNYSHPINTHACSNIKLDIQVQGLN
jgi:GTPase SAR1 family protein